MLRWQSRLLTRRGGVSAQFWGQQNVHYHQGMKAGENTLNALCERLVVRGVAREKGAYGPAVFLKDYVSFMTTPGSHNDTYAESFHRDFFANWAAGVPPEKCAGKEARAGVTPFGDTPRFRAVSSLFTLWVSFVSSRDTTRPPSAGS